MVAAAVVAGSIGLNVSPADADNSVTSGPWKPGRANVSPASGGISAVCSQGIWFTSNTSDRYMAIPGHCVYNAPDLTTPKTLAVKYYKVAPADGTSNSFDNNSPNSFVKPTGSAANYDLVLVKFNSTQAATAYSEELIDYRIGGSNTKGAGPWGGGSMADPNYTAFVRNTFALHWYDADTPLGYTGCKSGVRGGTSCGLIYGNGPFTLEAGATDWVTPTLKVDIDSSGNCGAADGDSGGPWFIDPLSIPTNSDNKAPILGIHLGVTDAANFTDSNCYGGTELVGFDARVLTVRDIKAAYPSLGLVEADWDDTTYSPYPTTTITIGNRAIAGTSNSVSCWQAPGAWGDSTLNCYRYDQWGNAISNDSYTLPFFCSTVAWLPGTSILAVSNNAYFNAEREYPHIDWNGLAGGCYKGNDQNGSSGFYESETAFTDTCNFTTQSGCVIVNAGYAGGSWWNSPGVSRDTYSGYGGELWPDGRGVYTRIIYTQ